MLRSTGKNITDCAILSWNLFILDRGSRGGASSLERDHHAQVFRWLDLYLGVVKGHWKNSLKIGHVTNTYIGGMYAFTMNSHDPKGLMRL